MQLGEPWGSIKNIYIKYLTNKSCISRINQPKGNLICQKQKHLCDKYHKYAHGSYYTSA